MIVGHCAYSRAYVEWAAAIFVALSPSVARGLEALQDDFLRLAAGPALVDAHPSALRSLLGCPLPVGRRLSVARARFAFDDFISPCFFLSYVLTTARAAFLRTRPKPSPAACFRRLGRPRPRGRPGRALG